MRDSMITAEQMARERLLFRYDLALHNGDALSIAAILQEAETDPTLEQMIVDYHADDDNARVIPKSMPTDITIDDRDAWTGGYSVETLRSDAYSEWFFTHF